MKSIEAIQHDNAPTLRVSYQVDRPRREEEETQMKALSLRQPWCDMVVRLGKHIENRKWNTKFRGEFLIHAAKGCTRMEYEESWRWARDRGLPYDVRGFDNLDRGGIVGVARLVDVLPPRSLFTEDGAHVLWDLGADKRWHMEEQFGFILADIEPVPFIPYQGALGFFGVSDEAIEAVKKARHAPKK